MEVDNEGEDKGRPSYDIHRGDPQSQLSEEDKK